jgi:hypothetical protein
MKKIIWFALFVRVNWGPAQLLLVLTHLNICEHTT